MADRTIKPDSGNDLVLQNNGGGTKIEIPNSGDIGITGTIGSGTFNGTIGDSATFPAGHVIQVKTSSLTTDKTSTSTSGESINATFKVTLNNCISGNLIIAYLMGGQLAMTGSTGGYRIQLFCSIESVDVYGQFNKNYTNQNTGPSHSFSGAAISNMFFHTISSSGSIDVIPKIRVQSSSFGGTLFADTGASGSSNNAGPCRLTVMEIQQ